MQTLHTETATPLAMMPEPDSIPQGKGLLINRNFAWMASGQAISNLGDFVYSTTLFIWVFTITHSAAAVSGVLAAQYLPVFLLGPLAGVFVDRWNRRRTMLISDLIRAAAATLPLLAPQSLRLQAIYTSVFLISALGRFFLPAESADASGLDQTGDFRPLDHCWSGPGLASLLRRRTSACHSHQCCILPGLSVLPGSLARPTSSAASPCLSTR